jgi:hypothetical protein
MITPYGANRKWRNILVSLGLFFSFLAYIFIYGQFEEPFCKYTEDSLEIPEELRDAKFYLEKDSNVVGGENTEYSCLREIGKINNDIWDQESMMSFTSYFTREGRTIEPLKAGKVFALEKIIAVTKHGISTIDSGPGPIYFLVLKDGEGVQYKAAPGDFGTDEKESIMRFEGSNGKGYVSYTYFEDYLERLKKDSDSRCPKMGGPNTIGCANGD